MMHRLAVTVCLLAVAVRYMEFVQACDLTMGSLNGGTNRVVFVPSPELRSGSTAKYWAEDAEQLLRRCVQDHADTPWAHLAQRELDYPLGVMLHQQVITKPPPRPIVPARPARPAPMNFAASSSMMCSSVLDVCEVPRGA